MLEPNAIPLEQEEPARKTFRERFEELPFGGREKMLAGLSLIPAAMVCLFPQISAPIRAALLDGMTLALGLLAIGRRKVRGIAAFYWVSAAAMILMGMIFYDAFLFHVNLFAVPMLLCMGFYTASGVNGRDPLSYGTIGETIRRGVRGVFEYVPLPILRLFRKPMTGGRVGIGAILLSLMACMPVLALVLLLLCDADEVFCSALFQVLQSVQPGGGHPIIRVILTAALALMLFSWLYGLNRPGKDMGEGIPLCVPTVFAAMLMILLNLIYGLFVFVQFSTLFGGAETAAMTGGYAQYARNGFFQLAAVAAINLGLLAVTLTRPRLAIVRILCGLLIAATGVILVSAVWRMRMYIQVYGLSVLRVLTLWGMLAIACLLVVALIKLIRPNFRAFAAGFVCLILLWTALNGVNIDRMIVDYNVSRYDAGELKELDRDYLETLSPGAQRGLES